MPIIFWYAFYIGEEREMKKNDVIKEIASRLNLPKLECEKVIETFADVVTEALVDGDKVIIKGFISFETSECKERNGYNPQTGKSQHFDSVKTVKCKVGKPIKDAVNDK